MGCERYREMLSAQLDGEEQAGERATTDAHLLVCPGCRQWLDAVAALNRLVRTGLVPEITGAARAAAPGAARAAAPGRVRLVTGLRLLLGALSTVQILLGLVQITAAARTPHPHPETGVAAANHLWHESAAWNVAVGAGLLWIALRRGRPVGMVPTLTAFIAVLSLLTANDMMTARVDFDRVLSHGFILTGYVVVLLLSRYGRDTTGPPTDRQATGPAEPTGPTVVDAYSPPAQRPTLRLLPGLPPPTEARHRVRHRVGHRVRDRDAA